MATKLSHFSEYQPIGRRDQEAHLFNVTDDHGQKVPMIRINDVLFPKDAIFEVKMHKLLYFRGEGRCCYPRCETRVIEVSYMSNDRLERETLEFESVYIATAIFKQICSFLPNLPDHRYLG